jgi:nitrite reductase/ring-hydroxylating ferredoxin subunit
MVRIVERTAKTSMNGKYILIWFRSTLTSEIYMQVYPCMHVGGVTAEFILILATILCRLHTTRFK